jgi:hypothetical protein
MKMRTAAASPFRQGGTLPLAMYQRFDLNSGRRRANPGQIVEQTARAPK